MHSQEAWEELLRRAWLYWWAGTQRSMTSRSTYKQFSFVRLNIIRDEFKLHIYRLDALDETDGLDGKPSDEVHVKCGVGKRVLAMIDGIFSSVLFAISTFEGWLMSFSNQDNTPRGSNDLLTKKRGLPPKD